MTKKRKIPKNKIFSYLLLTALTLLCAGCVAAFILIGNTQISQFAAERFRGLNEARFAQVSAFYPVGSGLDIQGVYSFRTTLEGKLVEASLEEPETGSLWQDAYVGEGSVTVKSEKASSQSEVLAVGGDFFLFHPLTLLSGHYIYEDDLMHDGVLLDEVLAWQLYGGTDLEGMTVTIEGKPYLVAGVVKREDNAASRKAAEDKPLLIMQFDAYNAIKETKAVCYELVCADPISGYAQSVVEGAMQDAAVLQNTDRFTLWRIIKVIASFGRRSMVTEGVAYPYWENAARLIEDYMGLLLVGIVVFGLYPATCLIWEIYRLFKRGRSKVAETVPAKWESYSDRRREKQRLRLIEKEKHRLEDYDELQRKKSEKAASAPKKKKPQHKKKLFGSKKAAPKAKTPEAEERTDAAELSEPEEYETPATPPEDDEDADVTIY